MANDAKPAGVAGAPRLELAASKALLVLFVLFGLLFTAYGTALAAGLVPARDGESQDASQHFLPALILIPAGAFVLLVFGRMLIDPRPIVVADGAGLHYRPRWGAELVIPWTNVRALARVRSGKTSALGVWVRDRDAYFATRPAWMRGMLRARSAMGGPEGRFVAFSDRRSLERFVAEATAAFGLAVS